MNEIQIRWKDAQESKYALNANNIHEIHPLFNCVHTPFIVRKSGTELYIKAESAIKIINNGVHKVFHNKEELTINVSTNLDTGSISAGTDYYIYLCDEEDGNASFIISDNSENPSGYTANAITKIGGFHTLCVNVGTITNHPLSGELAGNILPDSVWDLSHRPFSEPEGMVYSEKLNIWVDIYLTSGTGTSTASVNGGTISDTRSWLDFVDDVAAVKKRMLTDVEFQVAAEGANEETNITGSADPVTTGGHTDTSGRRMISNIGCEDMCGVMYQWLNEQSFRQPNTPGWAWFSLPGDKGSIYNYGGTGGDADTKLLAGGRYNDGTNCGSRSRIAHMYRWNAYTSTATRGCSNPYGTSISTSKNEPDWILTPTSFYVDPAGNDTTGNGTLSSPWATVGNAISYLNDYRLNAVVTINVAVGHYSESEIIISHPDAYNIRIVGASILNKSVVSVQSNSGSAGAWSTVINLNNVTDIVVGDYVLLVNLENGTNPRALHGFYRISNVDAVNNRITVENKNKWTSGPSGAITGDSLIYKTILQFNSTNGFTIYSAPNNLLNRIALINIGSMSGAGFYSNPSNSTQGIATLGYDIGINGFSYGIRSVRGGSNASVYNISISNTNSALRADGNATIAVASGYCLIAGNTNGIYAIFKGYISFNSAAWVIGNNDGVCALNHSLVYCANAIVSHNSSTGMLANLHGVIYGDGSQVNNNTYDFFPTVNTEGNISSYIRVP